MNKTLFGLICILYASSSGLIYGSELISDDFNDGVINPDLWNTWLPFGDSVATETGGSALSTNRGSFILDVPISMSIKITGRFRFSVNNRGNLQLRTRSDNTSTNPYGQFNNGVLAQFSIPLHAGDNNIRLSDPEAFIDSYANYPMSLNTWYDFILVDTGTEVSLFINDIVTPILTITTNSRYGDYINFQTREGSAGGSSISNGNTIEMDFFTVETFIRPTVNSFNLKASSYSLYVEPANTSLGETIYFTTYDGSSGTPLHDEDGVYYYFSSEFTPVSIGSTHYRTDYLVSESAGIYEYGSMTVNFSFLDQDNNGMIDLNERGLSANSTFSGTTIPDWNYFGEYYNASVSGSFNRSTGASLGSYSGTVTFQGLEAYTFSGVFSTTDGIGLGSYEPGNSGGITFTLEIPDVSGTTDYQGTGYFSANGLNEVILTGFTLNEVNGDAVITAQSAILTREGRIYRGNVRVDDGGPYSSWPDFRDWLLEINDQNDWDNDGIPDLTDPPPQIDPPAIVANPQASISVTAGSECDIALTATGENLQFIWKKNGIYLPQATGSILHINNVGSVHAGEYQVVVSNTGGEVISQMAHLTVEPPAIRVIPSITGTNQLQILCNSFLNQQYALFESSDLINWIPSDITRTGTGSEMVILLPLDKIKRFYLIEVSY